MHEVLVNSLGGLSLPRKSVVRLTDHPDMTLDVYRGRKTTTQQQTKYTGIFVEKNERSFCIAKALIFSAKNVVFRILMFEILKKG